MINFYLLLWVHHRYVIFCALTYECMFISAGFTCSIHNDGVSMRAYTSDGTTYFWGKYLTSSMFYELPTLTSGREYSSTVLEVVAGPNHGLILTSDGEVS